MKPPGLRGPGAGRHPGIHDVDVHREEDGVAPVRHGRERLVQTPVEATRDDLRHLVGTHPLARHPGERLRVRPIPAEEPAVDSRSEASDRIYRFAHDGKDAASPYARTVRLAKAAHKYYATLVKSYDAHGYNARVNRITKRELNRAANTVADLIAAMS